MPKPTYSFRKEAAIAMNSGLANSIIMSGNIQGLFFENDNYMTITDFLTSAWDTEGQIIVIYQPNGKIRILDKNCRNRLKDAWSTWKNGGTDVEAAIQDMLSLTRAKSQYKTCSFSNALLEAEKDPLEALQFLRQLCICSRLVQDGKPVLPERVVVIIEQADMLLPQTDIAHCSSWDRQMVSFCREWFTDPLYCNGADAVIFITETVSGMSSKITKLPQMKVIDVPFPGEDERLHYIRWFNKNLQKNERLNLWGTQEELARVTGGMSLHALRKLLLEACHLKQKIMPDDVIRHIQEYIIATLGEDVVEVKKPHHQLKDLVGFSDLKKFLKKEFIPRLESTDKGALPGAAVCGPIGCGKTFIFEAVAAEADMLVLVLKNLRSKWFGETDVIFESLRQVLESLSRVLIFVDEADTQFGGVDDSAQPTERRLTGKIQAMMSDPRLKGKIKWLLMTARIHLLSPDIRRPGRVGDLIIPVFDPEGEDCKEFLRWAVKPVYEGPISDEDMNKLLLHTKGYSAAGYSSLRTELQSRKGPLSADDIITIVSDIIPPEIGDTREYQKLQALLNCARKSLMPKSAYTEGDDFYEKQKQWREAVRTMESRGIR